MMSWAELGTNQLEHGHLEALIILIPTIITQAVLGTRLQNYVDLFQLLKYVHSPSNSENQKVMAFCVWCHSNLLYFPRP